jgi:dihydropyrimidinase
MLLSLPNAHISRITKRLISNSRTLPFYHATARPQIAESEATHRAISLATLTDTPILIVHMSSPAALNHARKAQKSLLPIHAETCPHYLFLLSSKLAAGSTLDPDTITHDHTHPTNEWEGAKHVCAPPLRHSPKDLDSVWQAINNNTITVISSDHAPSSYDHHLGKRKPVVEANISGSIPTFASIPNGLPGIETRLPLLFSAAQEGRISMSKFVALCCTNPAKMYGLDGVKGSIAPGYDADLVIWYPPNHSKRIVIHNEILHHSIDYTPFEGVEVGNWPRFTILRGVLKWDCVRERAEGHMKGVLGKPGDGKFLKRKKGMMLVGKTGQVVPGMKVGERELWMDA